MDIILAGSNFGSQDMSKENWLNIDFAWEVYKMEVFGLIKPITDKQKFVLQGL